MIIGRKQVGNARNLNVNKSQGPDNIHPKILKEANEVLAKPLQKIFETSFKMKQIPLDWKTADISAIFKKGNKIRCWQL